MDLLFASKASTAWSAHIPGSGGVPVVSVVTVDGAHYPSTVLSCGRFAGNSKCLVRPRTCLDSPICVGKSPLVRNYFGFEENATAAWFTASGLPGLPLTSLPRRPTLAAMGRPASGHARCRRPCSATITASAHWTAPVSGRYLRRTGRPAGPGPGRRSRRTGSGCRRSVRQVGIVGRRPRTWGTTACA